MPTRDDKVISFRVSAPVLESIEDFAKDRGKVLAHAVLELVERGLWTVTLPVKKARKPA